MSKNNNSKTDEMNKNGISSQKENLNMVFVIYSAFLGILYLVFGILEMINYLAVGLSLDDFNLKIFSETEDYFAWSGNSIMSLAFIVISTIFFFGVTILLREKGDRGKAYFHTGITLAIFLLMIFLLVVLAENISVIVETLDANESIIDAEWLFNAYSPIYLGVLSLPGVLLYNYKKLK